METLKSPYMCHIFVCTNDRQGERKSCSDNESMEIRKQFKQIVESRGWKPNVRVSQCGCMGLCPDGPNVMLYPQSIWFSHVKPDDVETIATYIAEKIL